VGKGKEQGVFGQKAIFFLPLRFRNRGGRPAVLADGDWRRPGVGGGRDRGKGRGGRGLSIPSLTLVGDGLCRRLLGDGRRPAMVVGAVVFGSLGKQGGSVVVVRGEVGNAAGLFVGVERRFIGRYFELAELRQWRFGKVRRGLRPTEFAVNSALWDWTHCAGELAEAAKEGWKAATRCGVEVTGRQGRSNGGPVLLQGWVVSRLGRLEREWGRGWRAAPASCRALGRPALG
jgi:hypothetical protein